MTTEHIPTAGGPGPGRMPITSPVPPPDHHQTRTGTIVWGLITVVVGLLTAAVAVGRQVDLEIALIGLFLLAGLGLLIGAVVSAAQRPGRQRRGG